MRTGSSKINNFGYEQQILQGVSRSFALTIPQLPNGLREVVTNAYLLCRIADTIEDEENLTGDQKRLFFREFVDVIDGKASADQFANALYPLLSKRSLPAEKNLIRNTPYIIGTTFSFNARQQAAIKRCITIMTEGMQKFQTNKNPYGLKDLSQLDSYCYHVAGVVGELLTDLFCEYSEEISRNRERLFELAPSFGQGLQMTNILKDCWDDKAHGACWLPQDVFKKVGFDLKNLSTDTFHHSFGKGIADLISVAHAHLKDALTYTLTIPRRETGIRKFCLWAIGMAIFSLKNIFRNRNYYRSGKEVKISRRTVKAVIIVTNAALWNNYLLKKIFNLTAKGLPRPKKFANKDEGVIL